MKKIGIDARLYSQTGIGTYLKNLLYFLDKQKSLKNIFYVYLTSRDFSKVNFKNKNIIKRKADFPWHSLSEQLGFLSMLYGDNLDLMHFTYFSYPIFYFRKFIATVHDTTPLFFRTGKASTKNGFIYAIKHFFFKIVLRFQVTLASYIITPTNTVKNQLKDLYGKRVASKTTFIYEGMSEEIKKTKENKNLKKKYKKFFIYVGNFYPHKNLEKLIVAFSKLESDYKLILLGPNSYFFKKISRVIINKKIEKKVILFKNPSQSDLVYFYKNAGALIHPSFSEGFGLPLIESAYFNCPIIASDIPVFKELFGKQYLAFDPRNENDILKKIEYFIEKKPHFDYSKIVKNFSFSLMSQKTFSIYDKNV